MEKNPHKEASKKALINRLNGFLASYFKLIVVALSLTIFLAGCFIVLIPKYKKAVSKVEIAKNNMEAEYAEFSRYLNRLENINSAYRGVDKRDVERINSLLPDTAEVEGLMTQLEVIAKSSGAMLVSLSIDDPDDAVKTADRKTAKVQLPTDGLRKIKIGMNLVGLDYAGLKNLLGVIENNLRLLDVNNLAFSPKGDAISLEMTAYYYY